MILTIDISNSGLNFGVYKDDKLEFTGSFSDAAGRTTDEIAVMIKNILDIHGTKASSIEGSIVSSVVPKATDRCAAALRILTGKSPLIVGPGIKTGLNIRVDDPAELGSDWLAISVAAANKYPKPIITIELGTATTIGAINEQGSMIGGALIPGITLSLDALASHAAQLPQISISAPISAISKNTIDCMRSGIIYGNAALIDGMIRRFRTELGVDTCTCVATGPLANVITSNTTETVIYDANLLHDGLNLLYKKNSKKF